MVHNSERRQSARDTLDRFLQQVEHRFSDDTINQLIDLVVFSEMVGELQREWFEMVMQYGLINDPGPEIIHELYDAMRQNADSSTVASDVSTVTVATLASNIAASTSGGSNDGPFHQDLDDDGNVEIDEGRSQGQFHVIDEARSQGFNSSSDGDAYSQPQEAPCTGSADSSTLQGENISQQTWDYSQSSSA
jgi:hypothetical protein